MKKIILRLVLLGSKGLTILKKIKTRSMSPPLMMEKSSSEIEVAINNDLMIKNE
jgi:hypothetical protein